MNSLLKKIGAASLITGVLIVFCHAQVDTLFSEWRPNADTAGVAFIGNQACIDCHPRMATYSTTPMAQALEVAPDCRIITARGRLTFRNGQYTYEISHQGKTIVYSVSDGTKTIKEPILFCFGQGHIGQTYLFRHNDLLYETRVSYFEKLRQLDVTIGHKPAVPTSLDDALGRAIG